MPAPSTLLRIARWTAFFVGVLAGFPTLVTIAPGRLHGMTPDMSYIEGAAAGD